MYDQQLRHGGYVMLHPVNLTGTCLKKNAAAAADYYYHTLFTIRGSYIY